MTLVRHRRALVASVATLVVLAPLVWFWQASLIPGSYQASSLGYHDYGGGPRLPGTTRSVASLTEQVHRTPDVRVTLTARRERGHGIDGYTLNHRSPGPTIRARQGQLVEVRLVNASVPDGVTLHWHGVDVPNAEDGVAGVTQDAVRRGHDFTYRFVVRHAGTYWYHSHQVSHEQVAGGLLGALVVEPAVASPGREALALVHDYGGRRTVDGAAADRRVDAPAGAHVRVRVVNTNNGQLATWPTGPYRVLAVDGHDVHEPGVVRDRSVIVAAGGRVDLDVTAPARVELSGVALVVGSATGDARRPTRTLDLLRYGTPAPIGFDPATATRHFTYSIGRRPGFLGGRPGLWWTINGHPYPDVPMFTVDTGDVVVMRIDNHSGSVHPMHLHGHHVVVLRRNDIRATGSPWWTDSLTVANNDTYDVAFVADNPGVWIDHCHNLPHASDGLVTHLMYEGVTEPYRIGSRNHPE
ncbi:MAG TPA: multicopper oxidase family protein [Actinocatenispora sp.]